MTDLTCDLCGDDYDPDSGCQHDGRQHCPACPPCRECRANALDDSREHYGW